MKRFFRMSLLALAAGVILLGGFTSCSDDDNPAPTTTPETVIGDWIVLDINKTVVADDDINDSDLEYIHNNMYLPGMMVGYKYTLNPDNTIKVTLTSGPTYNGTFTHVNNELNVEIDMSSGAAAGMDFGPYTTFFNNGKLYLKYDRTEYIESQIQYMGLSNPSINITEAYITVELIRYY